MTVITIIGGGFSGAMVATNLLRQATEPLKINLIERHKIGEGIAYGSDSDWHLLNVPVGKMSAFAEEPEHFCHWLKNQGHGVDTQTFVSRKLYGQYIKSLLESKAAGEVSWQSIQDEAVAIDGEGEKKKVYLASGKVVGTDQVVLALGHLPPAHPQVRDASFYQSYRYVNQVWDSHSLKQIEPQSSVLILGSGLTAVDVVMSLYQQGHRGKIHLLSRRGLLPQSHQQSPSYPPFLKGDTIPQSLGLLVRLVRQEISTAEAKGYPWQAVMDSFRHENQDIWQKLTLGERRRFLRHLRPYWDIHRHRICPKIATIIDSLTTSGQLIRHKGRVQAYIEENDHVNIIFREPVGQNLETISAHTVINCTGNQEHYGKSLDLLRTNLLESGLVRLDPLALGLEINSQGQLIRADGQVNSWLYTLGPVCKGSLWETTAVAEIRQQARRLALDIVH